ncbi:MAG: hypothetical protein WCL39_04165 [Armatimonadota bacterium]
MPTFGLEEEVFVTEPTRPSLRSLYYLARLLARNPKYYYIHSASNFARLSDMRHGLMSGIELSTGVHDSAADLIEDLKERRNDLAAVASGLIVSAGHLLEHDTPTNVCGLQIHLGSTNDKERTYRNIVHFLPLLMLLTANSPSVNGKRFGKSYRIYNSFAIGPIASDRTIRFQDIIFSKRLGTIEVRVCDPAWDIARVSLLVQSLAAIEQLRTDLSFDPALYNDLRRVSAKEGYTEVHQKLYAELRDLVDVPEDLFISPPADTLWSLYETQGAEAAYSASDNGYRTGVFEPNRMPRRHALIECLAGAAGIAGYWVPKLPYYTWKAIVES